MRLVKIYDTTLRDGNQEENTNFSANDKIRLIRAFDEFGMDYIEIGWPNHNSIEMTVAKAIHQDELKHSKLAVFGSTRKKNETPEESNLSYLIEAAEKCGCQVATIYGKSWVIHAEKQLDASPDENLEMICDSITHLKTNEKHPFEEVIFDAEHYFDGFKDTKTPDYAFKVLRTAILAGADQIVLCDTNGGCVYTEVHDIVRKTVEFIDNDPEIQEYLKKHDKEMPLGIHCHNDSGFALANTIASVFEGVSHVQGTVNGMGERAGNVDLFSVIPTLLLKIKGYETTESIQNNLHNLVKLSEEVRLTAKHKEHAKSPYTGRIFDHAGGSHVDAFMKGAPYAHINPELVGNRERVILGIDSGRASALYVLQKNGFADGLDKFHPKVEEYLNLIVGYAKNGFNIGGMDDMLYYYARKVFGTESFPIELDYCVLNTVYANSGRNIHEETAKINLNAGGKIIECQGFGNSGLVGVGFTAMKDKLREEDVNVGLTLVGYDTVVPPGEEGAGLPIQINITYKTRNSNLISTAAIHPSIDIASLDAGAIALTLLNEGYKA